MQQIYTATLAEDVRFRCDLPTFDATSSVSEAQVYRLLQQSIALLSQFVQSALSHELVFYAQTTLSTVASQAYVNTPTDMARIASVTWVKSGDERYQLNPANKHDKSRALVKSWDEEVPSYELTGKELYFYPTPSAVYSLSVQYTATQWISTTPSGANSFYGEPLWAEWVVLDVCSKIRQKEQKDASDFLTNLGMTEQKIVASAPREEAAIHEVVDTWGVYVRPRPWNQWR